MTRQRGRDPSQRQLRVGEELRHVIAHLFERGELRDPDLREVSITVSEVRVSPDLRQATVYVMPLGGGNLETVLRALKRAAPFLKSQVGDRAGLRYVPDLHFHADPVFDEGARLEALLRSSRVARDLTDEPGDDADDDSGDGAGAAPPDGGAEDDNGQ